MSLRINQNVTSLATYSNLNKTAIRNEKSIEKLSSGLRINSASDDATGLAISEKMRSQVRGLNRAKLNAQDGVSMIQVAEGGLNETESIVQRMRDLAIQASNDTLTSNDRLEIQKEINQLKSAVDNISDSTEFNTKKLLNGSQTANLSSSSNSISGIVTGDVTASGSYNVSMTVLSGGISQIQKSQIFSDKNTGELAKGNTKLEDIAQFYDENGVFALDNPQTLTITGNAETSEISINGKMTLNELASTLQNTIAGANKLGIQNSTAEVVNTASTNISGLGGYIQLTSGAVGDKGNFSIAGDQAVVDALGFSVTRQSANNQVQLRIEDGSGNIRTVNTSSDRASGLIDGMDIKFDSTAAQIAGNGGIVDGLRFDALEQLTLGFNTRAGSVTFTVDINSGSYSMEGIADLINTTASINSVNGLEASVVDGQIRLNYNPEGEDISSEINITQGSDTLGFLNGIYSGFVDGDKNIDKSVEGISLLNIGQAASQVDFTIDDGMGNTSGAIVLGNTISAITMGGFDSSWNWVPGFSGDLVEADDLVLSANNQLAAAGVAARVDIVNGSIAFTSTSLGVTNGTNGVANDGSITLSTTNSFFNDTLGIKNGTALGSGDTNYKVSVANKNSSLQIGANDGQTMQINMAEMSSKALGIDKLDMSSSEGAQAAIEKIDQALSKISAERSKFGAYINRLDHTMSNLENTAANLTDSESRIRDVDMASEMIDFASSQIMQQSGTAMLAQANLMSQSVLSLLS